MRLNISKSNYKNQLSFKLSIVYLSNITNIFFTQYRLETKFLRPDQRALIFYKKDVIVCMINNDEGFINEFLKKIKKFNKEDTKWN
jgi:hypothetical protein